MKYLVKVGKRGYLVSEPDTALRISKKNGVGHIKLLVGNNEVAADEMMSRNKNRA